MLEELVIGRCVSGVARIRFVMQMLVGVGAANGLSVVHVGIEIQDLRLPMIDPNHGMKVFAHRSRLYHLNQEVTGEQR
jgi:hypothetical protein